MSSLFETFDRLFLFTFWQTTRNLQRPFSCPSDTFIKHRLPFTLFLFYSLLIFLFEHDNMVFSSKKESWYLFINFVSGAQLIYWDSKVSEGDMDAMWKHPDVVTEWTKSGERRGNVRFSHDAKKRPYLSRVEVKVWFGIFPSVAFPIILILC
jgi:hypothetical protein